MSRISSLFKNFLIAALSFWFFDFCSGLQSGSSFSGDFDGALEYPSWSDFIHDEHQFQKDSFKHNLHNTVNSPGNQQNHIADYSYDGIDPQYLPSDLMNTPEHISEPNKSMRQMGELECHVSYSPEIDLQYGLQFQPEAFENHLEHTHGSFPHDSFSAQAADIFDHRQYIDEYIKHFENQITDKEPEINSLSPKKAIWQSSDQNLGGNLMIKSNDHHLPSQHQYNPVSHMIDQGPLSIEDYHLEGETQGTSTFNPFDINGAKLTDPVDHITLTNMANVNQPMVQEQGEHEFQLESFFELVSDYLETPQSKKRKKKSIMTAKTKKHHRYSRLENKANSNNNVIGASSQLLEESDQPIKIFGWHSIGKRVFQKDQISPSSENCSSKTRVNAHSKNKSHVLQKIGLINTNRSPKLCYEIYEFFREIYQNIGSRNNFSDEEIEDVRLAIKNAARGVTMTFLGMVKVFEADQDKVHDTEGLLCDGWSFIQEFYTSWNTMEHKDFGFGTKSPFETDLSYDPYFHLRYLKQLKRSSHIPIALTHSISLLWSKYRGQSKIPKDLFEHWEQVENVAKIDSTSIQGGLYGRLNIGSISFWGLEEFTRKHWYLNREIYINSKDIWSWASDAAQFHTSVGREACKDLHTFFEDLLQKLHINYNNNLKQVDSSPMLQAKSNNLSNKIHAENFDMIVRAISIAEYRVTVPFIGIVRSLNENDLTSDQLQKLLDNATGFLKDTFSQWNQLDFRHQNVQDLFSYQPVPKKIHSSMETYETMFRCLLGFADKNTFPSRMILNLLKLWRQSTTTTRLSSENDSPFPISDIPDVYSDALQTRFAELLAEHDSKSPRNIHNNVDNFKPSNPSVIYCLLREAFAIKGSEELDTDFDGFVQ